VRPNASVGTGKWRCSATRYDGVRDMTRKVTAPRDSDFEAPVVAQAHFHLHSGNRRAQASLGPDMM